MDTIDMDGTARKRLLDFYQQVDQTARVLEQIHLSRLKCQLGCNQCCVDEISVFSIEADHIRYRHSELLSLGQPHPAGVCAFLDSDGSCRIYKHRPYVCRTQGLPLRWYDQDNSGHMVEYRDICPLNETDLPITDIIPDQTWLIGPFEGKLATLQADYDNGLMTRVKLRELFPVK